MRQQMKIYQIWIVALLFCSVNCGAIWRQNKIEGSWVMIERHCDENGLCKKNQNGELQLKFYENGSFFYRNTLPDYRYLPMRSRGEYGIRENTIELLHRKRNTSQLDKMELLKRDGDEILLLYHGEIFKMKSVGGLKTG